MKGAITEIVPATRLQSSPGLHPLGPPRLGLRSAIRAMSQMGAGAIASGLLSAVATKVMASTLGPAGLAVLGTLQQCRETALVAATLNGQTALVQGASRLADAARREFIRTCMCFFGLGTLLVALVLLLAPEPAARLSGLGGSRAPLLRWAVAPVVLGAGYIFLNGVLNALGDVGVLAALQLVAPAVLALLAYPLTVRANQGTEALLPVLLGLSSAAAVGVVAAALTRHRTVLRSWFRGGGRWLTRPAARHFFVLSGSMLASGLASNCALLLVRARILRSQGLAVTGQFDASWAIGLNLSTLLLGSIQAYYLPLLARARTPSERSAHIAAVFRVAIPTAAVLIVGLAAMKLAVLRALYSTAFYPAAASLRWTLIGNYFKIASWIFCVPMLACSDARVFLVAELAAWAVFCGGTLALEKWCPPASSAAVSFVGMYAVHLAISSAYVRRRGLRLDRVGPVWLVGLSLVLTASTSHWDPPVRPLAIEACAAAAWMGVAGGTLALVLRKDRITECAG